jgi:hypothetical protein
VAAPCGCENRRYLPVGEKNLQGRLTRVNTTNLVSFLADDGLLAEPDERLAAKAAVLWWCD